MPLSCVEKNWQFLVLKALVIVKGKQSAHKLVTLREESCVCYDVVEWQRTAKRWQSQDFFVSEIYGPICSPS